MADGERKIVEIREHRFERKVEASVVKLLEDILADARAGKVTSVAVAIVHHDGDTQAAWSMSSQAQQQNSAIAILAHRYCSTFKG